MPRSDLRVLVVAEDPLVRAELAALLADQPDRAGVSQADGDDDLSAAVDASRPDVVVWDLAWSPSVALERLAALGDHHVPVVVLVPEEADAADAVRAGADGVVRRTADGATLMAAVRAASLGLRVIDPGFAEAGGLARDSGAPPLTETLTARESEVLQLLAEGLPNKAIAERLNISEHTAKFHVNAILGKLGAQNRTEAVTRAVRAGLILL